MSPGYQKLAVEVFRYRRKKYAIGEEKKGSDLSKSEIQAHRCGESGNNADKGRGWEVES